MALQRLQQVPNVTITTAEALLFELLGTEEHPAYNDICRLMKEHVVEDFTV